MSEFSVEQRIGDIVAVEPNASAVFKKYQIDFCCGGDRPLAEAIREQHLNSAEILSQLENARTKIGEPSDQNDFMKMAPGELVDYVVNTHHAYLERVLPELNELTFKILKVHGKNHGEVLFKVHSLFHQLKTDLEQHLVKEEAFLFPLMKEYAKKPTEKLQRQIYGIRQEIEAEHEAAGKILKQLRELTDQYHVPEDGCNTYRLTFRKLEELESDLFQHIHLENNILFQESQKQNTH